MGEKTHLGQRADPAGEFRIDARVEAIRLAASRVDAAPRSACA
jgi:hypothetical protein